MKYIPTIFTVESVVAVAPSKDALQLVECANKCIPPKAVVPETVCDNKNRKELIYSGPIQQSDDNNQTYSHL